MRRYLNRKVFVYTNETDEGFENGPTFERDILEHKGILTCILGGKHIPVHTPKGLHPSKTTIFFTDDFVSRETVEIAKRARRHR